MSFAWLASLLGETDFKFESLLLTEISGVLLIGDAVEGSDEFALLFSGEFWAGATCVPVIRLKKFIWSYQEAEDVQLEPE